MKEKLIYSNDPKWLKDNGYELPFLNGDNPKEKRGFFTCGRAGLTGEGGTETLLATASLTSGTGVTSLRDATTRNYLGEDFKQTTGDTVEISKIKFRCKQVGTISSGNVWCELWNSIVAGSSHQQGIDSTTITASSVSGSLTTYEVTWPSGSRVSVANNTTWYIVWSGDYSIDGSNYLSLEYNAGGGLYADGSFRFANDSYTWSNIPTSDFLFEIYAFI
jgi:hypothetical protein